MSEKPALCNGKCVGADYRCCFLTENFGCQLEQGRECAAVREAEFIQVLGGVTPGELLVYLRESGYFEAPASLKYHGAYAGGLFDHSRAVTDALIELTERLSLSWEKPRSPYIVGMFHDLCKLEDYRRTSAGVWEYNNAALMPGHRERSVMILQRFMTLTEEEMLCIRWHMGAFDDKDKWNYYGRACEKWPNVLYTHTADMIASRIAGV